MAETNYWLRAQRSPLSRRGFLKGSALAAGGVGAAALVGCGGDDDEGDDGGDGDGDATAVPTQPTANITRGGTLKIGSSAGGDSVYDPAITNHAATYSNAMGRVFNRLLSYDGRVNVHAELAESLPEQPDDQTYIFKIRDDITWHDIAPANGRKFTAEDAVFGVSRFNKDNAEFIQGQLDRIANIEAQDETTFTIETAEPFAPMVRFLADDPVLMVNPEQNDAVGDDGMKKFENQIGTGPFMRGEFDFEVRATVTRNPNYFEMGADGEALPYLDGIEVNAVSADAQQGAFIAGEFDAFSFGTGQNFTAVGTYQEQLGDDFSFRKKLHSAIAECHMHTEKAPFDDPRVRRAVHLVTNRQLTINGLGPGGMITMGPVPQFFAPLAFTQEELDELPGYREDKTEDIAEALALMDAAGVGSGAGETIDIPTPIQCDCHAVVIKEDVARLGLNLQLEPATSADYFAQRAQGNFIMNIGLEVGGTDPDTYLYHRFHTGAPFNRTAFSDAATDAALEKQRGALDATERAEAIREASMLLFEHSPQAFVSSLIFYPSFRSYVQGFPEDVDGGIPMGLTHNMARIWLDNQA